MIIKATICAAYAALAVWAALKFFREKEPLETPEPDETELDFLAADACIQQLESLRKRLESVEALITDIQTHESGRTEAPVVLSWHSMSGERHETTIYINASPEINERILALTECERLRLRCSLLSALQNVPVRHNANVNANDS